jgi:hypothetical protein
MESVEVNIELRQLVEGYFCQDDYKFAKEVKNFTTDR